MKNMEIELRWLLDSSEGQQFLSYIDEDGCTVWHKREQDRYKNPTGIYGEHANFISRLIQASDCKALQRRDGFGRTPWYYLLESVFKQGRKDDEARLLVHSMISSAGSESLLKPVNYCCQLPLHLALSLSHCANQKTLFAVVQELLQACPKSASIETKRQIGRNREEEGGDLPIHYACREKGLCLEMIPMLHRAYPQGSLYLNSRGESPFSLLCQSHHYNPKLDIHYHYYVEALEYMIQVCPAALSVVDSTGNLPFHHVTEAVMCRSMRFPLDTVWRKMVRLSPSGPFTRNWTDKCALDAVWTQFFNKDSCKTVTFPEIVTHTVEELLDMERKRGILLPQKLSQSVPHVLAYLSSTISAQLFEALVRSSGCQIESQRGNTTILHMFCLGLKYWLLNSSQDRCDFPQVSKNSNLCKDDKVKPSSAIIGISGDCLGSFLQCILNIDRNAINKLSEQGYLPLHLFLLHKSDYAQENLKIIEVFKRVHPQAAGLSQVNSTDSNPHSGLYPFMLAAALNTSDESEKVSSLDCTFVLLQQFVAYCNIDQTNS